MNNIFKKFTSYLIVISLIATQVAVPNLGYALEREAPVERESSTVQREAPVEREAPTTQREAPVEREALAEVDDNSSSNTQSDTSTSGTSSGTSSTTTNSSSSQEISPSPTPSNTTNGTTQSGQVGSSDIKTGDAVTSGIINTTANNNISTSPTNSNSSGTGATVVNSGNGSDSSNSGSATIVNNENTTQNNSAIVNSDLTGATVTGQNETSKNVGNSSITTGDANTSGTIITTVNTNADGIMVSEFNVVDDHVGDIALDFGAACISGCSGFGNLFSDNSGNGSDSDNFASSDITNNFNTFQNNDAVIGNNLILSADSGNNTASKNTGGDSDITTGDANVSANVLTFANNNIAGNIVYGVVNIFGDLIGDLIFDEAQFDALGTKAVNSGNGSGSTNNANSSTTTNTTTFQNNDANISNNLLFDANTGDNSSSKNTGGNSSITTGDTDINANVLNIANANLAGGNWWIVLVNEAGNWMGKIMGAPEGTTFATTQGSDYSIDENGFITVTNNANGAGSTNDASANVVNNNHTEQNNTANIVNNLDLSANTGKNNTNSNTGGNSNITTGDANIVANLVNFVNNNITGNGKLVVTVVNVFGSWIGDFVTPGQKKENKIAQNSTTNTTSDTVALGGNSQNEQYNKSNSVLTPTPTSNQKMQSTGNGNTTFIVRGNGNGNTDNSQSGGNVEVATSKVKGASFSITDVQGQKNVIKINLAWLLLLLPFAVIFTIRKKYFVTNKTA